MTRPTQKPCPAPTPTEEAWRQLPPETQQMLVPFLRTLTRYLGQPAPAPTAAASSPLPAPQREDPCAPSPQRSRSRETTPDIPATITDQLDEISDLLILLSGILDRALAEDCIIDFGAARFLASACDHAETTLRELISDLHQAAAEDERP